MNFLKDYKVSLSHYSGVNPIKSVIIGIKDHTLRVKLNKRFALMNFFENAPVVVGVFEDDKVHRIECNIVTIEPKVGIIELKINKVNSYNQKRQEERNPVSLYSEIKINEKCRGALASIKDLSCHGMKVYSKEKIQDETEVKIDIYLSKKVLFLKGKVIRVLKHSNYYENGIRITHENYETLNYLRGYLRSLKDKE